MGKTKMKTMNMKQTLAILFITSILSACATTQTNEEYNESQKLFKEMDQIFD